MNPPKKTRSNSAATQTGVMSRQLIEPRLQPHDPPPLAAQRPPHEEDSGATTGIIPVVTEGEDQTVARDEDSAVGE